jgi:hypothetical protein
MSQFPVEYYQQGKILGCARREIVVLVRASG